MSVLNASSVLFTDYFLAFLKILIFGLCLQHDNLISLWIDMHFHRNRKILCHMHAFVKVCTQICTELLPLGYTTTCMLERSLLCATIYPFLKPIYAIATCSNSNLISRQRRYRILTQRILTNEYSENTLYTISAKK
jgi:hypothetical protein